MDWKAWLTIVNIIIVIVVLFKYNISPEKVLTTSLFFLVIIDILPIQDAFEGFTNEGLLAVAILFIVAAGVEETGAIYYLAKYLLGKPSSEKAGLIKLMASVSILSAFFNNTTIVAIFLPVVKEWSKKNGFCSSIFLIPLSYATILGGMCTTIGTSTSIIINSLLRENTQQVIGLFDISLIGIPSALIGMSYIYFFAYKLFRDKEEVIDFEQEPHKYIVAMKVKKGSLIGKTIEEAGLRHLSGLFLMEIERKGKVFTAVSHSEKLEEEDILVFVGMVDSIIELRKVKGLSLLQSYMFESRKSERIFIEAVVSQKNPFLYQSIRDSKFRTYYNAVIIAVSRGGEKINKKIGDIVLLPGDKLLLEVKEIFIEQQKRGEDFILITPISNSFPYSTIKIIGILLILVVMIFLIASKLLSMLRTVMLVSVVIIMLGFTSFKSAFKKIDWNLIVTMVAALGIGKAFLKTGAATYLSQFLFSFLNTNPIFSIIFVYVLTVFFTEFISNQAAAILMFPIALSLANTTHTNLIPYVLSIMFAASASFATPIGYQTNLMVYGPGNYKFSDFVKIGLPLNILVGIVNILMIIFLYKL